MKSMKDMKVGPRERANIGEVVLGKAPTLHDLHVLHGETFPEKLPANDPAKRGAGANGAVTRAGEENSPRRNAKITKKEDSPPAPDGAGGAEGTVNPLSLRAAPRQEAEAPSENPPR